jgi:hypothetical protein
MAAARPLLGLLLAAGLALPAPAQSPADGSIPGLTQVVSPGPEQIAITIYQDPSLGTGRLADFQDIYFDGESGLALVTEWRTLDVPAGESRISFKGVAEGIVAQTAAVDDLPAQLVERNQDFDLLSPGSLVARSLGETVSWVRTDPATGRETSERAVIRSGPDGVVLDVGGRIETLKCSGGAERLIFDRMPSGLSDRPTLSLRVRAPRAGRYRVRLTYLSVGVLWAANYVARINPDGQTLDLSGWITLKNTGRTGFANALTQVVAGEVERGDDTRAVVTNPVPLSPRCWPMDTTTSGARLWRGVPPPPPPPPPPSMAMAPMADAAGEIVVTAQKAVQTDLGDYKLYTLASPTTVAAQQTKQVMMLQKAGVRYDRVYLYRLSPDDNVEADDPPRPTVVMFRTENRERNNLGLPLPGGDISIMEPNVKGGRLLVGEGRFRNTGVGAPLEIDTAQSVEVQVTPRVVREQKIGGNRVRHTVEVAANNNKAVPVMFELRMPSYEGLRVIRSAPRHQMKPAGAVWAMTLKPGERRIVTLTVETDW